MENFDYLRTNPTSISSNNESILSLKVGNGGADFVVVNPNPWDSHAKKDNDQSCPSKG